MVERGCSKTDAVRDASVVENTGIRRFRGVLERLHGHGDRHGKPDFLDHAAERRGRQRALPNEAHVRLQWRPHEAILLDNEGFHDSLAERHVS